MQWSAAEITCTIYSPGPCRSSLKGFQIIKAKMRGRRFSNSGRNAGSALYRRYWEKCSMQDRFSGVGGGRAAATPAQLAGPPRVDGQAV